MSSADVARVAPLARGGSASRTATKNAQVYASLKEAILSGRLPPGAAIDKATLCDTLGVSRFPVAAALSRLALERLVVVVPQHGSFVPPLALGDMLECMMMRVAIEGDTASLAATRQPRGLSDVLTHHVDAATHAADPHAFYQLDVAFHEAILASLGLAHTRQVLDGLRDRLERIRRILAAPPGRPRAVRDEHAAVRDAVAAGDPDRARAAMRQHLDSTTALFRDFARQNPSLFSDHS